MAHDRKFGSLLATRIIEMTPAGIVAGNYADYLNTHGLVTDAIPFSGTIFSGPTRRN